MRINSYLKDIGPIVKGGDLKKCKQSHINVIKVERINYPFIFALKLNEYQIN